MIKINSEGLAHYVTLLKEGKPFSFVRFGNGEWDCIFQSAKRTRSGSQDLDIQSLRQALLFSLVGAYKDPSYYVGLQSQGFLQTCGLYDKIEAWIEREVPDLNWYAADVFHRSSREGQLHPLIQQLHRMSVVVVGPNHLINWWCPSRSVRIASRDCWQRVNTIEAEVLKLARPGDVVSFSAGPAAKVLIHRLFPKIGNEVFLLDFGSLWDVFAGMPSRNYQRDMTAETLRRNLG